MRNNRRRKSQAGRGNGEAGEIEEAGVILRYEAGAS